MTSPASALHQNLALFLAEVLDTYVAMHDLGEIMHRTLPNETGAQEPRAGRSISAKAHVDRLTPPYLNGPAAPVVETGRYP